MENRGDILVIDDDPDLVGLVSAWFERAGYKVAGASNGEEALSLAAGGRFDLAVLDIMLPGMDGLKVLKALKEIAPGTEVIMLSAQTSLEVAIESMRLGAMDYIKKPFQMEQLEAAAEKAVEKRRFNEIAMAAFRAGSLSEVIISIESSAASLFGGDEAVLFFREKGGVWQAGGGKGKNAPKHRIEFYAAALADCGCRADPMTDAAPYPGAPGELPGAGEVGALLVIPLPGSGAPEGAVCVGRLKGKAVFGEGDLRRAKLFAPLVLLALKNGELSGRLGEVRSQLVQTQKMEALGLLAGQISHDFNNLLAVIIGSMQLMLEDASRTGGTKMPAEVLQMAREAEVLVKQLLLFSRGEETSAEEADLSAALEEIKTIVGKLPGAKGRVFYSQEPDLPRVKIKKSHFKQVVLNLAANAVGAAVDGSVTVSLRRPAAGEALPPGLDAQSCVMLEVCDEGPGIAQENLGRIFEPFFTTKAPGKGTGMGLHIVRNLVMGAGGEIMAGNRKGGGAVFRVFFPAA